MKTGGIRTLSVLMLLVSLVIPRMALALPKVGVFGDSDYTQNAVTQFETNTGIKFDSILWYKSDAEDPTQYWQSTPLTYAKNNGKDIQLAFEIQDSLANINAGNHDAGIRAWASWIKALDYPVYLRPLSEMNGNWTYWSGNYGTNKPEEYPAAYRRIVNIFRSEGATKVKFIWAVNNVSVNRAGTPDPTAADINIYYPGDSFVDYLGMDGYDFGTAPDSKKQTFAEVFGPIYERLNTDPLFTTGKKPIIIPETASVEPEKPEYIRDMFYFLSKRPRIEQVYWFNISKERDWRINSTQASTDAFKAYYKTPPTEKCGDVKAGNYEANYPYYNNSTCYYPPKEGCTDKLAYNFDNTAVKDNGTCRFEGKHNRWF